MKKSLFLKAAAFFLAETTAFFLFFNLCWNLQKITPWFWLKLVIIILYLFLIITILSSILNTTEKRFGKKSAYIIHFTMGIPTLINLIVFKKEVGFSVFLYVLGTLVAVVILGFLFLITCFALSSRYLWAEKVTHTWIYYTRKKYDPPEKKTS